MADQLNGRAVVDFTLPSLGADMEEATILEWRIAPGDAVTKGDIVALIDTEKSEIDLEIWDTGTVVEMLVAEGDVVPVGQPLARLSILDMPAPATSPGTASVAAPAPAAVSPPVPAAVPAPAPPSVDKAMAVPRSGRRAHRPPAIHSPIIRHLVEESHLELAHVVGTGPGGSLTRADVERATHAVPASPLARRLASERALDLRTVNGSGPDGAVLATDLPPTADTATATATATAAATTAATGAPAAGAASTTTAAEAGPAPPRSVTMRTAIANLMTRSNRDIPHYHLAQDVDLDTAMTWLEATNAEVGAAERILPAAVLLRASALALTKHPELNGFWVDGGFEPGDGVHLGVAVSMRGGGLIAPAIIDADTLPLPDLMAALRDLVNRARAGRLKGSEMSSATTTVTNLGDRGPDLVHGVIHPPQVALIGFGRITRRAVVDDDGTVVAHPMVTATLAADHRATDGDRGARLLARIDQLLQKPDQL